MKDAIVKMLVALLSLVTAETLRYSVSALLDVIEVRVKESKTEVDDMLVIPLCTTIRKAMGISQMEKPEVTDA